MIACDAIHIYMHTTQPHQHIVKHEQAIHLLVSLMRLIHTIKIPRDKYPPKPVYIPRPKGVHPQLVTPQYGPFTHLTLNPSYLGLVYITPTKHLLENFTLLESLI